MKTTLTTSQAANLLLDDKYASWSRAGAFAIIEHLEDIEAGSGEEMEFDAVAIRCDFAEYSSLVEFADAYFGTTSKNSWVDEIGANDDDTEEDINEKIREYIRDNGQLIEFDGGIIVSSF